MQYILNVIMIEKIWCGSKNWKQKRGYFRLKINEAIMHNTHGYASSLYVDNHSLLVTTSAAYSLIRNQDSPINADVLMKKLN